LKIILLFSFLFILSCGNLKSGKIVKIRSSDTIRSLSEEFGVPQWVIQASNTGGELKEGDLVFIPLNWGILGDGVRNPLVYSNSAGFIWPVPKSKKISSNFGNRGKKKHYGIDIPGNIGDEILAVDDGVVVYSGNEFNGYGNVTIISHRNGFFSMYAHNNANYTQKGDRVNKGDIIAELGNTGRSTGPHLHFEIRRESTPINPVFLLTEN
jgi:murein DD-endopeptidase MepM/ murein hydrolase activator NlpD